MDTSNHANVLSKWLIVHRNCMQAHGKSGGTAQEWVRAMLSTVGRGGNAQAVRDEILNIMHRNNVKEKNGTWMEQWHQKLHNNTTPDDIGICEAYIAFLKADGDNGVYWRVLSDHGASWHAHCHTLARQGAYNGRRAQDMQLCHAL